MWEERGPGPMAGRLAPGPVVELHGTPPPLNDTAEAEENSQKRASKSLG